jgi:GNAT superfamily N-acetyltransferase
MRSQELELIPTLVELFNEVYGPPPWVETARENEAAVAELFHPADGRKAAVAIEGDHVIGVAQGSFGEVLKGDLRRVDAVAAESLREPLFEFHQLVVAAPARGRGIGAQLHDALMADLATDAILETHPSASAALGLYRARGWREHGVLEVIPGVERVVMTLAGPRRSTAHRREALAQALRLAGWMASSLRDFRCASQWVTSSSYAGRPMSSTSSGSLDTYTGSTPTWASVFPEQYQSRS